MDYDLFIQSMLIRHLIVFSLWLFYTKYYENFNASISEKFSSPLNKYPQTTRSKTGGFNKSGK